MAAVMPEAGEDCPADGTARGVSPVPQVRWMAFLPDWARKTLDINPKNLVLISATGDSMEPTLREGDLLLVNTGVTRVIDDGIYAIRVNDTLMVKRIQRLASGELIIKSDNPAYKEQMISNAQAEDLRIIGRLVWIGRKV